MDLAALARRLGFRPEPVPAGGPSPLDGTARAALGWDLGLSPWHLYLDPRGRIGRATFWRHGVLALLILDVVGIALMQIAMFDGETAQEVVYVVLLWPALVLSIKRWHDIGRSGWFVLVNLIPIVGQFIALVVNGFVPGTVGPNRYGRDPLAARRLV
jgi:uncharacterized membrane protein YhaH (DUF805 family)